MRPILVLFAILSVSSHAQTPDAPKSFIIADVHTSPFTSNPFMHGNSIQGDRYFLTQATMAELIATAYGVDVANFDIGVRSSKDGKSGAWWWTLPPPED